MKTANQRHWIQTYIITKLISADGLRYSEISPEDVENDLYNYHLQYLLKEKYLQKEDNLYYLSNKGKQYIEDEVPHDAAGKTYTLFRVNILACCIKKENGVLKVLNQERKCHPFQGDIGIIGGPVNKGELIEDAAKRQFKEETGLNAEFSVTGIIRKMRYLSSGELFSDILFHICVSDTFTGHLIEENDFGRHFWSTIDESIKYEQTSKQGSKFLVEFLTNLKKHNRVNIPFFYHQEKKTLEGF